jgi:hypothetical protein
MVLKEGPTTFFSTAWQAIQFFCCAKAKSASAGVTHDVAMIKVRKMRRMAVSLYDVMVSFNVILV